MGVISMLFLELKASFSIDEKIELDRDLSSALRGVWGRVLRSNYCYQKNLNCFECPFENCTYYVLFEKKYSSSEQYHPYIIQARFREPGIIEARFKFFGWVCEHYEKLLYSIIKMDSRRLMLQGKDYIMELQSIEDREGRILFTHYSDKIKRPKLINLEFEPEECSALEIEFKTPLRQKEGGSLMPNFQWDPFAKSLINRVRFINKHFNQEELNIPEHIDISLSKAPESEVYWSEKPRHSLRQDSKMSIGGLLGKVKVEGITPEMMAILKLGSYLHCGKQCTFGNGEIELKKCQI